MEIEEAATLSRIRDRGYDELSGNVGFQVFRFREKRIWRVDWGRILEVPGRQRSCRMNLSLWSGCMSLYSLSQAQRPQQPRGFGPMLPSLIFSFRTDEKTSEVRRAKQVDRK